MENVTTWSGSEGYPYYYHYWYLFNHKIQVFIYLFIAVYLLKYKLTERCRIFAKNTILLYIGVTALETLSYFYYGNNLTESQNEFEYALLLGGFTFGTLILAAMNKAWQT